MAFRMRIITTILILFSLTAFGNEPIDTQKILGVLRTNQTFLLLISGESNATGYGLNTDASAAEKAVRFTQIWNPNDERMHFLDIPVNQLGSVPEVHGFELQFANLVDSGSFHQVNTYVTKAGEGSTRVVSWMPGSILYDRMIARINASIAYLDRSHGEVTNMWLIWTQGINDMFDSKTPSSWKDSTLLIFNDLHILYPDLKIIITKFNQPAYLAYNTVIQEIDDELDYVWAVEATSAGLRTDDTHWDYEGLKLIGRRAVAIIQAND